MPDPRTKDPGTVMKGVTSSNCVDVQSGAVPGHGKQVAVVGVVLVYAAIILGFAGIGAYCLTHAHGVAGWFLIAVAALMGTCLKVKANG